MGVENVWSVAEWLENNGGKVDLNVSPNPADREDERLMAKVFGVELPKIPYARYGTTVSLVGAEWFCRSVGAEELGFAARLTGSGMSAIQLALRAAGWGTIIAGKVLYGLTPEELNDLSATYGVPVHYVDSGNLEDIMSAVAAVEGKKTLFFETIGNGVPMPVLDLRGLLKEIWTREDVTLILDNTFATCALFNPFSPANCLARLTAELGNPACTFVYLESLSKYYRADVTRDPATGGVIMAPQKFMTERVDPRLMRGHVIATPALLTFPADLYGACKRVMLRLSTNAEAVAQFLSAHRRVGRENVWYPIEDNRGLFRDGMGGVLYFNVPGEERGVGARLFESHIPFRASFGHAESTHVDFGAFGKDPPGLIRLAVGVNETPEEVVENLEACLG
ncbi:MAG: hypothetical protein A3C90_00520 [Candidatus Magasanikbacteria bacterium RIFCSPHIGHO2_02_FULL_51_14]|uniref:Cystathionine beta-lyase n=1 Tax=Candidatus Magasanikbacteria bacterium RIFCSPHIGHO2_02_FULL_51_14 TaxID=1798683 RepID=A0A1F6MHT6_9BACT|nr:MAG: hypothetical protein A3C90_00520 [Candidatus Magasanikbacteria bacterium RIFCSPHIGHO2_02_FULL_51_14]